MATPAEIYAAMASVPRPAVSAEFAPLLRPSMLQPAPRKPISTQIVRTDLYEAPTPVLCPVRSEDEPVWLLRIDVAAWRRKGWFWRLAASVVVRRAKRSQGDTDASGDDWPDGLGGFA